MKPYIYVVTCLFCIISLSCSKSNTKQVDNTEPLSCQFAKHHHEVEIEYEIDDLQRHIDLHGDRHLVIDLADYFNQTDRFYSDLFSNITWSDSVWFSPRPHHNDIIKAERINHYIPTIWSDNPEAGLGEKPDEHQLIQLISLVDLGYNVVIDLDIKDGYILLHSGNDPFRFDLKSDPKFTSHFNAITQQDLKDAIQRIPEEYELWGNHWRSYDEEYHKDWNQALPHWLKYVDRYKPGDFTREGFNTFMVCHEITEIRITYDIDGNTIQKSFYCIHHVGN